jgi:amino acid permease
MLVCMNALYMLSFFFVGNSHLFAPTSRSLSHLAKD